MTPRLGTKAAAVLAALRRRSGLTTKEAFFLLAETTLPSTVYALRRAGHFIVGKPESCTSRYGRTCRYMRYRCTNTGNTTSNTTNTKGYKK